MAQFKGGPLHDYIWDMKLVSALKAVRDAADICSTQGADALEVDSLLAVIFHIFSDEWCFSPVPGQIRAETRSFADWRPLVSSALIEAQRLNPRACREVVESLVDAIKGEFRLIVEEWSHGDPEQPHTEHVLNAVVHALFEANLGKRPASPMLPTSFLAM